MHSFHGDIHEEGLYDNCVACAEHAENPFASLDAEMLSNLVILTINMRLDKEGEYYPRSETEAIARANVMNVLEKMGKIYEVMQLVDSTDLVTHYFQRYWRINI